MIKVYGKKNCPQCEDMKEMLSVRKIEYTYFDLENHPLDDRSEASEVMAESMIVSQGALPIVRVGGHLLSMKEAVSLLT